MNQSEERAVLRSPGGGGGVGGVSCSSHVLPLTYILPPPLWGGGCLGLARHLQINPLRWNRPGGGVGGGTPSLSLSLCLVFMLLSPTSSRGLNVICMEPPPKSMMPSIESACWRPPGGRRRETLRATVYNPVTGDRVSSLY